MSGFERRVLPGACGVPQPWNWYAVCTLRPGHRGDHRRPASRHGYGPGNHRWDLSWPAVDTGPVSHIAADEPRAYVSEDVP